MVRKFWLNKNLKISECFNIKFLTIKYQNEYLTLDHNKIQRKEYKNHIFILIVIYYSFYYIYKNLIIYLFVLFLLLLFLAFLFLILELVLGFLAVPSAVFVLC